MPEKMTPESFKAAAAKLYREAQQQNVEKIQEDRENELVKQVNIARHAFNRVLDLDLDALDDVIISPTYGLDDEDLPIIHWGDLTFRAGHFDGGKLLQFMKPCPKCEKFVFYTFADKADFAVVFHTHAKLCAECVLNNTVYPTWEEARKNAFDVLNYRGDPSSRIEWYRMELEAQKLRMMNEQNLTLEAISGELGALTDTIIALATDKEEKDNAKI